MNKKNEIKEEHINDMIESLMDYFDTIPEEWIPGIANGVRSIMNQKYGRGTKQYPRYDGVVQRVMAGRPAPPPKKHEDRYLPLYGSQPADHTRCAAVKNVGDTFIKIFEQCRNPKGHGPEGEYCEECAVPFEYPSAEVV